MGLFFHWMMMPWDYINGFVLSLDDVMGFCDLVHLFVG
jgi:hypothetical protein